MSETKLVDGWQMTPHLRASTKIVYVNRPRTHAVHDPVAGGVAFVCFNPDLRLHLEHYNKKGVCTVRVSSRAERFAPFAIIGVYNPPATSPSNSNGKHYSQDILADVVQVVARMRQRYEVVLVCGDLNARLGPSNGPRAGDEPHRPRRTTEDAKPPAGGGSRTRMIERLLEDTSMRAVHGSPGRAGATFTSKGVGGAGDAEVDYFLADVAQLQGGVPGVSLTTLATPTLESLALEDASGVHRPIGIKVTLATPPPATRGAPPPPAAHPSPSARPPHAGRPPPYLNKVWLRSNPAVLDAVARVATAVRQSPNIQPNALYGELVVALQGAQASIMRDYKGTSDNSRPVTIAPNRTLRPTTVAIPHNVRRLIHRKKCTFDRIKAILRGNREDAQSGRELEVLQQRRDALTCEIRRELRKIRREKRGDFVQKLEQLRVSDPSAMFEYLKEASPLDPDVYWSDRSIPSDPEAEPAVPRFADHFRQINTENRPTPPGAANPNLHHIPQVVDPAAADYLRGAITVVELMATIFPPNAAVDLPHCLPGCHLCASDRAHRARWVSAQWNVPPPASKPHINTRKAAGTDGLAAETLRFARHEDPVRRKDERLRLCGDLAAIFNAFWSRGVVPTEHDFQTTVVTPLYKGSGAETDPDNYRGIAVGNCLPKIFALVMLRRLTHWAAANDIISPTQIGFQQHLGAEYHALTLTETIRCAWRRGEDAYVLFCDFRKAYDTVHLGALWRVMRHMGVPEAFMSLLESYNSNRTMRVLVNGTVGEPFPQTKGLPQGDVLSPFLFNLYIESLARKLLALQQQGLIQGLPLHESHAATLAWWVNHLLYADDLAVFARTPEELQTALTAVYEWGRDWGIDLGVGNKKTEAMCFPADPDAVARDEAGTPIAPNLPPLYEDVHNPATSRRVHWVAMYKYLGFELWSDLGTHGMITKMRDTMELIERRMFEFNTVVGQLSPVFKLQLLGTMLRGAVQYFMPVLPILEHEVTKLDTQLHSAARAIMGHIQRNTPVALLRAQCRLPTAWGLIQQHRLRIVLSSAVHPVARAAEIAAAATVAAAAAAGLPPPPQGVDVQALPLICRVVRAQHQQLPVAGNAAWYERSMPWMVRTLRNSRGIWETGGPQLPLMPTAAPQVIPLVMAPMLTLDATAIAAAYAGLVEQHLWRQRMRADEGDTSAHRNYAGRRPRWRLAEHVRDIYFSQELTWRTAIPQWVVAAQRLDVMPLSVAGPAGLGSIFSLCTLAPENIRALVRFTRGRATVCMWPFGHGMQYLDAELEVAEPAARISFSTEAARPGPCKLCGAPTEDPWHLLNECDNPHMVRLRADLHHEVPYQLRRMVRSLRTHATATDGVPTRIRAVHATLLLHLVILSAEVARYWTLDHNSPGCQFLAYRLVAALPYPAVVVPHQGGGDISTPRTPSRATRQPPQAPNPSDRPNTPGLMPSIVQRLGAVFDHVCGPKNRLRAFASQWATWSNARIHALAEGYRRALAPAVAGQ